LRIPLAHDITCRGQHLALRASLQMRETHWLQPWLQPLLCRRSLRLRSGLLRSLRSCRQQRRPRQQQMSCRICRRLRPASRPRCLALHLCWHRARSLLRAQRALRHPRSGARSVPGPDAVAADELDPERLRPSNGGSLCVTTRSASQAQCDERHHTYVPGVWFGCDSV
jgi:hypothetical protein